MRQLENDVPFLLRGCNINAVRRSRSSAPGVHAAPNQTEQRMSIYPQPERETERMAKLREYAVLDSLPEETYERVTKLAASILGAPLAAVSLIDEDRQWIKSRLGFDAQEIPREVTFCAHAICQNDVFVVEDATRDERFYDNPFVTGEPGLRFYAGAPLQTSAGLNMGTICVLDTQARTITDAQKQTLEHLAAIVIEALECRMVIDREERAKQRFIDAMECLPMGFSMYDPDDRLIACNGNYRAMFPNIAEFIVSGASFEEILREGVARGQFPEAIGNEESWIAQFLENHQAPGERLELRLPDDKWIGLQERRTSETGYVGFTYDITPMKRQEQELARLAWTDSLTGCLNRHRFMELAGREIDRAGREGSKASLLLLDADHFKQVNDRDGHAAGDAILKGLVERWQNVLRSHELIGRIGGEEFCVLLPGTGLEGARSVAEQLRKVISELPFAFEGQLLTVTVSLGVAVLTADDDLSTLLRRADLALYEAKEAGRDRFTVKAA